MMVVRRKSETEAGWTRNVVSHLTDGRVHVACLRCLVMHWCVAGRGLVFVVSEGTLGRACQI